MLQARNGSEDYRQDMPHAAPEPQSQDFLKVIWRWKWLTLLGALTGAACGYLMFSREQPTYQSSAMIQVVYPTAEAAGLERVEGPDGIRGQSRLDESLIIKSTRVIELAVEMGHLDTQPLLAGMSRDDLRRWVLDPQRLVVEPAGRDSSTALIEISFVCHDPQLCQIVVDSVIAGYEGYLDSAYKNLGDEVVKVVTLAQDNLRKSYESLSTKHATFRKQAPMIWLGDEARNQFAENSVEINSAINQIQIEMQKLQATLQHVGDAEEQGRPAEAILLMLASDSGMIGNLVEEPNKGESGPTGSVKDDLPYSSAERRAVLMELQIREQELLDTVGQGHPSVATIRRKIELLERQITYLSDSEKRIEAEQIASSAKWVQDMTPAEKLALFEASMQERLAALARQEGLLRKLAAENESKSKELQEYLTENQLLNSELDSLQRLLDSSTQTLNRIQVIPQNNRRTLETLTPANLGVFFGPALLPFLFGGTALGFLATAGMALLVDWLDKSFRSPDEISAALGMSIIGHVPQMSLKKVHTPHHVDASLCTITGSCEQASEAIRSVRTGLYFSESGSGHRIIQVTSPVPGDGKSTISANLAASIAQSGRSVLLIDGDLRRPRIAKLLGSQQEQGLGEVLQGTLPLREAVCSTAVPYLAVLAGRNAISNPTELLSHQRFVELLEHVKKVYDYVIVDTPPILAAADACAVAARVDGVLLTLRLRRDSKPVATQATRMLETVGARVLGVVVNGVTGRSYDYQYNNYGYYGVHKPRPDVGSLPSDLAAQANLPNHPR